MANLKDLIVNGASRFIGKIFGTSAEFSGDVKAGSFTGNISGNASSATALTTSAGSATQPVYFSGGKPAACSYTLGKSVPSNAVFTDTNTWRPVQNNLTSTSTSDSLSAAQGKILNDALTNLKSQSFSTDQSNFLTVGKKGARFTTITAAIIYAAGYCSGTNRVTILVYPGVYNESLNLMGFSNGVGTGIGNPGIDIIGCGFRNTIVKSTNTYPNSTIYTIGQGYFEGLAFVDEGTSSYALHYEAGGEKSAGTTTFKNCYFETSAAGCKSAVGAGLAPNNTLELDNCIIRSAGNAPLYFHNRAAANATNQSVVITNCRIEGSTTTTFGGKSWTYSVMLDDAAKMYGLSGSKMNVIFANNIADKGLLYRNTTSTGYSYLPNGQDITLDAKSIGNNILGLTYDKNYLVISQNIFKPTNKVYNQSYYSYSVIFPEAKYYNWAINNVTISGLANITSSVTISSIENGCIVLKDTNTNGAGYTLSVSLIGTPK